MTSAETLAYAVATGEIGDPRSFKRPIRVTTSTLTFPTDDVLVARKATRGESWGDRASYEEVADNTAPAFAWKAAQTLDAVWCRLRGPGGGNGCRRPRRPWRARPWRQIAQRSPSFVPRSTRYASFPCAPKRPHGRCAPSLRRVHSKRDRQALLSAAAGIVALRIDDADAARLSRRTGHHPATCVAMGREKRCDAGYVADRTALSLTWLAHGSERTWVTGDCRRRKRQPNAASEKASNSGGASSGTSGASAASFASAVSGGVRLHEAGGLHKDEA